MKLISSFFIFAMTLTNAFSADFCYKKFLYQNNIKTNTSRLFCLDTKLSLQDIGPKSLRIITKGETVRTLNTKGLLQECIEGYYMAQHCSYSSENVSFDLHYLVRRSCDILTRSSDFSCIGITIEGNTYY